MQRRNNLHPIPRLFPKSLLKTTQPKACYRTLLPPLQRIRPNKPRCGCSNGASSPRPLNTSNNPFHLHPCLWQCANKGHGGNLKCNCPLVNNTSKHQQLSTKSTNLNHKKRPNNDQVSKNPKHGLCGCCCCGFLEGWGWVLSVFLKNT